MDDMLPCSAREWDFAAGLALRYNGATYRIVPGRRVEVYVGGRLRLLMVNRRGFAVHYRAPPVMPDVLQEYPVGASYK